MLAARFHLVCDGLRRGYPPVTKYTGNTRTRFHSYYAAHALMPPEQAA